MPLPRFAPSASLFHLLHSPALRPLQTFVRTVEERRHPAAPEPFLPGRSPAVEQCGAPGPAAEVRRERGRGRVPTIVLGGFVPDSGEQVFLLRRFLLARGDLYPIVYPKDGFSLDLICAQLDDLVGDLRARGERPVILAVSFGAGLALEWLRRCRERGGDAGVAGVVLVSPVACVADLIPPGPGKPATLVGRVLRPFLDSPGDAPEAVVERARQVFARMFEAGAQNREALGRLMTPSELGRLHTAVMSTIRGLTGRGARERVGVLASLRSPLDYFSPVVLPLTSAPALVLFAEREDAMLDAGSPTAFAFRRALSAYFPAGATAEVRARPGSPPVQHASLIFHVGEFLPPLHAFYGRLPARGLPLAA
jgi:hypothetical protein